MKNMKLIIGLLFIYSCSPVITNIKPSPSKSITPSTIPSNIQPSDQNINHEKTVVSMKIINSENLVLSFSNDSFKNQKSYIYNALFNDSEKFICETIYDDGSVSKDVVFWNSSNPESASVDQTGLVKIFDKTDKVTITATLKSDKSTSLSFDINVNSSRVFDIDRCDRITKDKFESNDRVYLPEDYCELKTFNGNVYDPDLKPVEGVTVSARSIDTGVNWVGQAQITKADGSYVFRNAPAGSRISITITKDGWSTRTRSEVIKSDSRGDPFFNTFDFSTLYAIQDEPEITQVKINGKIVNGSSNGDVFTTARNEPKNSKPTPEQLETEKQITNVGNIPHLTGVDSSNLEIEMTFSEPINREDVENYFRITSQSGFNNKVESFVIDKTYLGTTFEWFNDGKSVVFKTNKSILSNNSGEEARYLIDFSKPFRDKTDKSAIDRRYFRFSPSQINDFSIFSVKHSQ